MFRRCRKPIFQMGGFLPASYVIVYQRGTSDSIRHGVKGHCLMAILGEDPQPPRLATCDPEDGVFGVFGFRVFG